MPLLTGLLVNAPGATAASSSAAVEIDATALRAALTDATARGATAICELFSSRTRQHMRDVADRVGLDVRAAIKQRFNGALQRALVLLLEPAEEYYARKLHAALYGLRKTPDFDIKLGASTRTLQSQLPRSIPPSLESSGKRRPSFYERKQSTRCATTASSVDTSAWNASAVPPLSTMSFTTRAAASLSLQ